MIPEELRAWVADLLQDYFWFPWVVVIGGFLSWLFKEQVKKAASGLAGWAGKKLMERFTAGLLIRRGVSKYRKRLLKRYATFHLPFHRGRKHRMNEVYIPLHAVGEGSERRGDAYAQVRATPHTVVIGPPGAGKSMLLRHSLLVWAQDTGRDAGRRIPVLLELRRCRNDDTDLVRHLMRQLEIDGFPVTRHAFERLLARGKVTVLFDGLDEVVATHRVQVAQDLRDFAAKYHSCQTVVTCRTAIYRDQLAPEYTVVSRIAEFDDNQLQRFMSTWPGMADKGVEPLLAMLRRAPRLRQIIRNPLLATMMAYLYTDEFDGHAQQLPRSRPEFYRRAVDALLHPSKRGRDETLLSQFPSPAKRDVLQRIALRAQSTPVNGADGEPGLGYRGLMEVVTEAAPSLNFSVSKAQVLVDEIVDRSGLLLKIDGGERYQFAHLTLQEYFAACALVDDPDALLEHYRRDPETWRETVRLWCGITPRDCAPFVTRVAEHDSLLALECVADAVNISSEAADDLVTRRFEELQKRLWPGSIGNEWIAAFASVAADRRPRGKRFFRLFRSIANDDNHRMWLFSCRVLAATNLPEAAEALAEAVRRKRNQHAVLALTGMGDIAVPALRPHLDEHDARFVIDLLHRIGTPAAAEMLVQHLWSGEGDSRVRAAWYVGALLGDEAVEAAITDMEVPRPESADFRGVLGPGEEDASPEVRKVAAQVAHVISAMGEEVDTSLGDMPSGTRLDPRLAIGIYLRLEYAIDAQDRKDIAERVRKDISDSYYADLKHGAALGKIETALDRDAPLAESELMGALNKLADSSAGEVEFMYHRIVADLKGKGLIAQLRGELLNSLSAPAALRLLGSTNLQFRSWKETGRSFSEPRYSLGSGSHGIGIIAVSVALPMFACVGWLLYGDLPLWSRWASIGYFSLFSGAFLLFMAWSRRWEFSSFLALGFILSLSLTFPFIAFMFLMDRTKSVSVRIGLPSTLLVLTPYSPLAAAGAAMPFVPLLGWAPAVVVVTAPVAAVIGLLWWLGGRKERRTNDPLRDVLELGALVERRRTSVIAG